MGSKTSSQQNQQQSVAPDPYARSVLDSALGRAQTVSQTPFNAYSGPLTANFNGQENTATNALNGLGGAAGNYFNAAAQQGNASTAAVNPTGLGAAQIAQFSNPYQSSVINATQAQIANQDAIQSEQNISSAIGAGAFGGDRAGVAQAALQGQQSLSNNSTLANLNSSNYSQALGAAQQQQGVQLSADQANRAAVQQNAQLQAGLGSASTSAGLGVANAQLGAGALQQQTTQAADTAQYGQFEMQQAYPFQTTQYLADIAEGISPQLGSTTTGQSTTQTSPLNGLVGGASSLLGFFSDERLKEEIRPIGETYDGQKLYSYRYKGEDATRVGLVAQEVERRHPHAVSSLGGAKIVDYREATRAAADRGHFWRGGVVHDVALGRAALHDLGLGDVRRASGGAVGFGSIPYASSAQLYPGAAASYVPNTSPGSARLPTSKLNFSSPSTSQQPQQSLGGLAQAGKNFASTPLGDSISDFTQDNLGFARGGNVGLGGAGRGYDAGGVVADDSLVFDPTAVGGDTSFAPGLGLGAAAAQPQAFVAPTNDNADVPTPQPRPAGLGAATAAPAPTDTPAPATSSPIPNLPPPVPQVANPGAAAFTGPNDSLVTTSAAPADGSNGLGAINAASPPSQDPMGGYNSRVAMIESSGGKASPNIFQFQPGTWSNVMRTHPDLGLTSNGVNDPAQQQKAMGALTTDNTASLTKSLGRAPTPDELYLAHQQGAGGAAGLLANPNARAGDIVGDAAVRQNGGDPDARASAFTSLWKAKFNGITPAAGGLAYAGGSASSGLGGAVLDGARSAARALGLGGASAPPSGDMSAATAMLPQQQTALGRASDFFGSRLGGTGVSSPGHSGGIFGLVPGMSDQERAGLISFGGALAGSTSKSFGTALGQGIQGGVAGYNAAQDQARKTGLAWASIANQGSEIQNRGALQGVERDKVTIAGKELGVHAQQVYQEGQNYKSEDAYRKQEGSARLTDANAVAQKAASERYMLIPGPDGEYRYLDRTNPGAGMLTPGQVTATENAEAAATRRPPALSLTSGSASSAGGAPSAAGGTPSTPPPGSAASGPASLDSSHFMSTGNPTLAAPQGYKPANYYGSQLRQQTDPVAREAAQKQTAADVTEANERAQKAYSSRFYSDEMDRNAAALPNSGLLVPGGAFPERLDLAKNWNAAMTGLGLDNFQVDPNAAKAGESLVKDKGRLGAQLTSTLGSREAATVFGSMMSTVPGGDNSRAGYKAVSSSIRALAQRDIDRNAFYQDWSSRYGSTNGAEPAFNQLNPAMGYARQAQSLARIPQSATDLLRSNANDPRAIAGFERQYGPGTARYYTGQFAR